MYSPNVYEVFGEKLKELRKEEGITQEELAEKLEVSKTTVVNYENANRKVPLDIVVKIAQLFNVSVDTLLNVNTRRVSNLKRWNDEFEEIAFTEEENYQLIQFGKYLLFLRKDHNDVKAIYTESK